MCLMYVWSVGWLVGVCVGWSVSWLVGLGLTELKGTVGIWWRYELY